MRIGCLVLVIILFISHGTILASSAFESIHPQECSHYANLAGDVYENKHYGITYDQWLSQYVVAHINLIPLEVTVASIIYDDPTVSSRGDAHQYAFDICSDLSELKKLKQ